MKITQCKTIVQLKENVTYQANYTFINKKKNIYKALSPYRSRSQLFIFPNFEIGIFKLFPFL